jgi:hypothetical protein
LRGVILADHQPVRAEHCEFFPRRRFAGIGAEPHPQEGAGRLQVALLAAPLEFVELRRGAVAVGEGA